MGELRSLNTSRDQILREITDAPADSLIVVVIDSPDSENTHMRWSGRAPGIRFWAYLAGVCQALVTSNIQKNATKG